MLWTQLIMINISSSLVTTLATNMTVRSTLHALTRLFPWGGSCHNPHFTNGKLRLWRAEDLAGVVSTGLGCGHRRQPGSGAWSLCFTRQHCGEQFQLAPIFSSRLFTKRYVRHIRPKGSKCHSGPNKRHKNKIPSASSYLLLQSWFCLTNFHQNTQDLCK